MRLVICKENMRGDSLMCAPALCEIARRNHGEKVYYAWRNDDIKSLLDLPANLVDILNVEPQFSHKSLETTMLGVHAAIGNPCAAPRHPIRMIYEFAGLGTPEGVPKIEIKPSDDFEGISEYDIAFGIWTSARERTMTKESAFSLFEKLHESGIRFANIGGPNDPYFPGAANILGQSYMTAAQVMRRSKVVCTVDTFQLHLAHGIGASKHIILDSTITPWTSQGYGPTCTRVQGWQDQGQATWNVDEILTTLGMLLL